MEMVCVTVEIGEGALTHRVRITAQSIERALKITRAGKSGRRMRLILPIDPEVYFAPGGSGQREAV
jgi:hypothetical protein